MKNIKIAIIDTGIDIYDKSIKKYIKFSASLQMKEYTTFEDIHDIQGHGTLCAKTILEICKNVEIYPIKIFNEDGITSTLNLIYILNNILKSDIDLINISASTLNDLHKEKLDNICNEVCKAGKIMIASHHNKSNGRDSFPACLNSVIGVVGKNYIFRDTNYMYTKNKKIQIVSNANERLISFCGKITHFGKNSRASAVVTGIIANIILKNNIIKFEDLEKVLIKESKSKEDLLNYEKVNKLSTVECQNRDRIVNSIINIVNNNFAYEIITIELIKRYSLFNNITQIGNYNAYEFLDLLNNEFSIEINYKDIFLYQLKDLERLVDLIYKNIYF